MQKSLTAMNKTIKTLHSMLAYPDKPVFSTEGGLWFLKFVPPGRRPYGPEAGI